ncbi:MAG: DUF1292 domain-containing protein [Bacilli bacterium]
MDINKELKSEEEKMVMDINLEDGTVEKVEVLFSFEFTDTKKEYIVYTKNEIDSSGNVTIYVSSVTRTENGPKLGSVESDEEWSKIKDVLRELSKDTEQQ